MKFQFLKALWKEAVNILQKSQILAVRAKIAIGNIMLIVMKLELMRMLF
jgi:hypothetical protein